MATTKQRAALREIDALADKGKREFAGYNRWRYLYVIRCQSYYKIGIAYNMDNRLNSLQCGNPYELEITYAVRLPNADKIENYLQQFFKNKHHFREWFSLEETTDFDFVIRDYLNGYSATETIS